MPNPPFDARDSKFIIIDSDGSSTRDLSAFLTGVDFPMQRELIDTSKIGDSGHTWTPSLQNNTFVLEGLYDNTATSGPDVVLTNILGMTTATTFVYAPTGTATDQIPLNRQIAGSCWIRSYNPTGRVATVISFRAEGAVEGVVTFSLTSA